MKLDMDVAEANWLAAGGDATLWEFIETCTHRGITLTVKEKPFPVGKIVKGQCPRCGQTFREPFGPFLDRRRAEGQRTKWQECALSGLPIPIRLNCDCNYCRRLRNVSSY